MLAVGGDGLVVGVKFEKDRIGGVVECAVVIERAFVGVVAGIKLVVFGLFVLARDAFHPWIFSGFGHLDGGGGQGGGATVADGGGDGDGAGILRALEEEFIGSDFLDDRPAGDGPCGLQIARAFGFHGLAVGDIGNDFDGVAAIPCGRCLESDDGFRNILLDCDGNVLGLGAAGEHRLEQQDQRGVTGHPLGWQGVGKPVYCDNGIDAVLFEDPIEFLRAAGLGGDGGGLTFEQVDIGLADGEVGAFLHEWSHQRLHGILVLIFEFEPIGGAGDA